MTSSFRLSTALVTSLSLAMTHMPIAALAQSDGETCLEGESAEDCLARNLEEAAAAEAEAAAAAAQVEAEAAAQAEAEAAAQAEADAEAARAAEEAAAAEAAAQAEAEAAEAAAQAEAEAAAAEEEAARAAEEAAVAEAAAQAEAEAAAQADAEAAAQAEADAAAQAAEEAAAAEAEAQAAEAARLEEESAAEAEAAAAEAAEAATEEVEVVEEEVQPAAEDVVEETPAEDPAAEESAVEAEADTTAPATDEEALAEALESAAEGEATGEAAVEGEVISEDAQTPEQAAELEAAAELAEQAEEQAEVDPVVEAETEAEAQAVEAEEQLQSMALADDAEPVGEVVEETITEEVARSAEEEFEPIVTSEPAAAAAPAAAEPSGNGGLSNLETALLAGAAGLVVGSILSGNRQVVNRADDRVVVLRPQGDFQVIRDDDVLLRRPGNGVTTENFADGSSRTIVTQPDGAQVVTIRDRDLRILRRTYIAPDGQATLLIDDTAPVQPVIVSQLPQTRPAQFVPLTETADADALRQALEAQQGYDRSFSLAQIRSIRAVRDLAPAIDLENVTFASGSASIGPDQARALLALGTYMSEAIERNPREIFLVEGHTDAVGSAAFNLALSDRRAESVALALSEYFGVAPQNLVIQGYGEEYLRIPTLEDERQNRRVAVRRITDLLQVAAN